MKVVVPHAPRITAETVAALKAFWPSYDPVNVGTDRLAYWRLLCQLWADGQDFTLVGLFGGVIGDDDAGGGLGFLFQAANDHAIVQGAQLHGISFRV